MGKRKSTIHCLMVRQFFFAVFLIPTLSFAQIKWQNVDSLYQPLPKSVHVFYTDQSIDTGTFRAFYVVADLKDKKLDFTTDTAYKRRLTPVQFYNKNHEPLVVVNGTFFSFETNKNLNIVIKDGKTIAYNRFAYKGKGSDSINNYYAFRGALGINKKRNADVAWTYSGYDSCCPTKYVSAHQWPLLPTNLTQSHVDGIQLNFSPRFDSVLTKPDNFFTDGRSSNWKVKTAIGGGPVLVQQGKVVITNEEENMFPGKAINDKHPRTAMGYTTDNKLVILVVQGRSESSGGATLIQEARILKDLGCVEALNLDGGGSSCLLVNGKETIKPSDKEGQRAVPAVFIIRKK
jgi:exopolysaccharide biosynthesis protein